MPFTSAKAADYKPSQPLPDHLAHKPVFAIPYEKFDGHFTGNPAKPTDIRFISVGLAQYDPDHVSVKTMRYTGEKWTRQAEEVPLHRAIDMTLFLAKVLFEEEGGALTIPAGTFHDQDTEIRLTREQRSFGELASYKDFLGRHAELYKTRLNALHDTLVRLKAEGKF